MGHPTGTSRPLYPGHRQSPCCLKGQPRAGLLTEKAWSYQLELAVNVELPPVEVIHVEGEVVIPTAAGVGEDIAATLGKSQEDMAVGQNGSGQMRVSSQPHLPPPSLASASPCIEKILIYDVLEGHADPRGQLPEKAR